VRWVSDGLQTATPQLSGSFSRDATQGSASTAKALDSVSNFLKGFAPPSAPPPQAPTASSPPLQNPGQNQLAALQRSIASLGLLRGFPGLSTPTPQDTFDPPKAQLTNLTGQDNPVSNTQGAPLGILSGALGVSPAQVRGQLQLGQLPSELAAQQGMSHQELGSWVQAHVAAYFPNASPAMVTSISRRVLTGASPTLAPKPPPSYARGKLINPSTASGAQKLNLTRVIAA
jgi:hypothetical protein